MRKKGGFTRTRIAPTPSGYLHLGNVFSFGITAAIARESGARILLRIDDLDRARVRRAYVEDIFATLEFLNIPWDEGPRNYRGYATSYSQSDRMHLYKHALQQLRQQGHVFACDCSRSEVLARHSGGVYTGTCRNKGLSLENPEYNWRIDTLGVPLPPAMQYFIVRKRDGNPAYQLVSVVDDASYGVDLVIRGEDLWESTQAQLYLAKLLGYRSVASATFRHHLLLRDEVQGKLSKSAGAMSIQYLRKQGKTCEEVYQRVGQLVGLQQSVSNWQQLGAAFVTTS